MVRLLQTFLHEEENSYCTRLSTCPSGGGKKRGGHAATRYIFGALKLRERKKRRNKRWLSQAQIDSGGEKKRGKGLLEGALPSLWDSSRYRWEKEKKGREERRKCGTPLSCRPSRGKEKRKTHCSSGLIRASSSRILVGADGGGKKKRKGEESEGRAYAIRSGLREAGGEKERRRARSADKMWGGMAAELAATYSHRVGG